MGTLFGKWQLLILRYPYLTRIIFGIYDQKEIWKKITRQGRVWLSDADFFWVSYYSCYYGHTTRSSIKNNSLCVCMCGYMFVLCPLLFFSRKGRMQVLLNSTCKMDQADSTVCMSFLSSNHTEENSPNADALRTKDQDQ